MKAWLKSIEWKRLDDVVLFLAIGGLIFALAKAGTKVPGEAWAAVTVLCTAVARTLKRNGGNDNGTNEEKPKEQISP